MNKGIKGIKIEGHKGTWYSIDTYNYYGQHFYIMESEIYGDEAPCVAIEAETHKVVLEDIYNGWRDLEEHLRELYPIVICGKKREK